MKRKCKKITFLNFSGLCSQIYITSYHLLVAGHSTVKLIIIS